MATIDHKLQIRGVKLIAIDCSATNEAIHLAVRNINRHMETVSVTVAAECGTAIKEAARCLGRATDALRDGVDNYIVNPLIGNRKTIPCPRDIQGDIYFGGVVGIVYQFGEWLWVTKYFKRHHYPQARCAKSCRIIRKIIPIARRYDFNRGRHWDRKRRDS